MEWWLLCWLALFTRANPNRKNDFSQTTKCMKEVNEILKNGNDNDAIEALKTLEKTLEETNVSMTTDMSQSRFVVLLHKPNGPSKSFDIHASGNKVKEGSAFTNSSVRVQVPRELVTNDTIVFSMITWPEARRGNLTTGGAGVLYESKLFGLSVQGKKVSSLQESVNITVTFPANETQNPICVFFNFSTKKYSSDGCKTKWEVGESSLTCCCHHLTYFSVLLVSPSSTVSAKDQEILSYITLIGCSLSLFALVITVLLFITNRKVREDVSMKVHINLAIALILLNLHFLPSQWVAAQSPTGLCLYLALSLHYSLLATFTWMALEGFHLYLLLVRVFNIYVRRYLLKLSVMGWGAPAVIVSLVAAIDRHSYGRVLLDSSVPNSTEVCYIVNPTVKMVTTVGVFGLVFVFNMIMLVVAVRRIVALSPSGEVRVRLPSLHSAIVVFNNKMDLQIWAERP
ncbi:adhesion G-protein coupled receptor G1-like isoform X2 [Cyclopterus lumpus]|uniref:adhesion G-protein coupled receptor G1-like isoform X2 n=1 Tax=Cyclopterus lumpus TaxID=8103 RepID=UPI001486F163|nr:adhesion G-protein coupled receptor G1-like isoform X2 [Cyclopterus lumpus]